MIRRVASSLLLIWLLGLVWFVVSLPRPAGAAATDGIIVPTGGAGRIERGIALIVDKKARRMLVTGVAPAVRPAELAEVQGVPVGLITCCVDLGKQAVDTRSNGDEAAAWVRRHKFKTIRLVTTDWHMPRARFELRRALGDEVTITSDAVDSAPSLAVLFREYNKLIARWAASLVGI